MIASGELWESVDHPTLKPHHGPPAGLCLVLGHNDSAESPDSYVMLRITGPRAGRICYMHRCAREAGHWVHRGSLEVV